MKFITDLLRTVTNTYKLTSVSWMQRLRNILDNDFFNKATNKINKTVSLKAKTACFGKQINKRKERKNSVSEPFSDRLEKWLFKIFSSHSKMK